MEKQGKDRRRYLRVDKSIRIACRRFTDQSVIRTVDYTKNISADGLLFESEESAPSDSILEITLFLDTNKIKLLGRVIRQNKANGKYEIAIQFVRIDEESIYLLKKSIQKGTLREIHLG